MKLILNHQKLELMESIFETFQIGKGDERIFSKDIEGFDLSFQDPVKISR